ncbi:hypothetical protein [Sorangium sp. So ce131]
MRLLDNTATVWLKQCSDGNRCNLSDESNPPLIRDPGGFTALRASG